MTSYPSSSLARLVSFGLALALAAPAMAVQPHVPAGVPAAALSQLGEPPRVSPAIDADESKEWAASDPAFRAFIREAGAEWSARWDRRTGHLSFASGTFPAWLPRDHRVHAQEEIAATRALLEREARALIARHPDLLAIPPSARLVLDERRSVPVDAGRLWQIDFRVELAGVPISNAHVSFRLNSGRLVQLGQAGLADALEIMDVTPRIGAEAIAARAEADLVALLGPSRAELEIVEPPRLELLPTAADPRRFDGAVGAGLQYRLAWRMTLRDPSALETWVVVHDALTGERVFVFDSNRYVCPAPPVPQGRVTGGVWTGPIETTTESVHGLPYAEVTNGALVTSDVNGVFPFTLGSPATTTLSGRYFDTQCATCDTPVEAFAQSLSPGPLTMGVGGNNDSGNGISTRAERNAFYHLNVIREIASKHLDDAAANGFFSQRILATVNIDDQCNAFYGGSTVNFFHAQGGCNNTGEIADVMQHEWGHGLDDHTGGINDGGASEGLSDVVAFHATHDPRMSPFFFIGDPNGIRNADENVAGLRTWGQVDALCPGREVHCVGEIYSQPWWHLAGLLRQRAMLAGGTEAAGWFLSERLFFQHLPLADQMDPAAANNMYDAVTLVDDDDGDLTNGIPDGLEINSAFSHHGFVSPPPVADSANCVPPPTPVVSLAPAQDPSTSSWQIAISWTDVPGAAEYRVFRNETGGVGAEVQVAVVAAPGLSFRDDDVADGITYYYRVMAFLPDGCFSVGENVQSTVIPDRLVIVLDALTLDDATAGNMNGTADPGERLTLSLTARNVSSLDATNVVATLSSTDPGVSIIQGSEPLGDMPAGAAANSPFPHFLIELDPALVACPDTVTFEFSFDAREGCTAAAAGLSVGPSPWLDDLETNRGWRVDPAGTDTATGGIWTRAIPVGTTSQVGEDHTPGGGTRCLVTGNLFVFPPPPDPADADDVEGGCTSVQSPVYDLGGRSGMTLSYWRAFDIQAPADDHLLVEIQNGPCGTWTELERLAVSTGGWAQASFPLDAVLGGPAEWVMLRFTACDTGAASIVEAAVDDIAFSGFSCDAPEMQPRLAVASLSIGDSAVAGGNGNGDGVIDPGESVRLPIDLRNDGNASAGPVSGALMLTGGPASVTVANASWPDIPVGQSQGSLAPPGHYEIRVPPNAACGSTVCGVIDVVYTGPGGAYLLHHDFSLIVGRVFEAFFDDFEGAGDNGVTHAEGVFGNLACAQDTPCDDWHHDTCTPTSQFDAPDTLVPGGRVWGNDLGDHGGPPYDGNFRNNCCNNMELPPIDCTAFTGLRLGFLRWLTAGAERPPPNNPIPGDQARIMIRRQADPGFTTIWAKPQAQELRDTEWKQVEYDISAIADGDPGVVIRFELETDDGRSRGGWTIDDLRVFEAVPRCTPFDACGAPPIPPATGPVLRATGRKDDDGAEFSWNGVVLAPLDEFRLYRGTIPSDVSTLVTPASYIAMSYDDRSAPGPLYFYRLVLANCLGQEGPADP